MVDRSRPTCISAAVTVAERQFVRAASKAAGVKASDVIRGAVFDLVTNGTPAKIKDVANAAEINAARMGDR